MGKTKKTGCPEGYPAAAWEKLIAIEANTQATLDRMEILENRVEVFEKAELVRTVSLLCAKMARMETVTCRLREELYSQKQYSMKYNLIFTFDATTDVGKEIEGEDAVSVVRQFLTHVMHVPNANQFCIPVAHRLGGQSGRRRAMLAKFPVATELDLIMRHGNRLRGTRHGVSRQTTPSMAEQNQFAMDTYKEKRSDASNKAQQWEVVSEGKFADRISRVSPAGS